MVQAIRAALVVALLVVALEFLQGLLQALPTKALRAVLHLSTAPIGELQAGAVHPQLESTVHLHRAETAELASLQILQEPQLQEQAVAVVLRAQARLVWAGRAVAELAALLQAGRLQR